jgi:protein-export SecD/SecF family membrane protein
VYEENTADPGVARDFAVKAIYAILAACISIVMYIGVRFSWSAALAILVSIIHDILIVSAIFAIFRFEIDVTYIAALLTIMGYSLNDKIVIFGRIRENAAKKVITNHIDVVNQSIRQTLGRSIYTVLTVVLAAVSLLLFACEPLQMFSLAILIGLISGAYSSIFLTSPLWLILHNTAAARHKTEFSRFKTTDRLIHATVGTLAIAGVFLVGTMLNSHHEIFAQATNQPHASLTAPLGDLSPFQLIAEDTLRIVKTGDLRAAKTRIRDLEAAWDSAEGKLRRMNPDTWKSVDKAIDRALSKLRSGKPDSAECIAALDALIAKCKSFSK